jgi:hypothetical protein
MGGIDIAKFQARQSPCEAREPSLTISLRSKRQVGVGFRDRPIAGTAGQLRVFGAASGKSLRDVSKASMLALLTPGPSPPSLS